MKSTITIRGLIFILLFLFSIPIIIYIINFHSNGISGKTDDWSNFSSFIGDILSPILNIGNIIVVYYLALKVNSIETHREEVNKSDEANRRINDFRYTAYKEISSMVFDLIKSLMVNDAVDIPPIFIIQLKLTLEGYNKLFVSIENFNLGSMMGRLYKFKTLKKEEKLAVIVDLNQLVKNIVGEIGFK